MCDVCIAYHPSPDLLPLCTARAPSSEFEILAQAGKVGVGVDSGRRLGLSLIRWECTFKVGVDPGVGVDSGGSESESSRTPSTPQPWFVISSVQFNSLVTS